MKLMLLSKYKGRNELGAIKLTKETEEKLWDCTVVSSSKPVNMLKEKCESRDLTFCKCDAKE